MSGIKKILYNGHEAIKTFLDKIMERVIYERPAKANDREDLLTSTEKVSFKDRILLSSVVKYVLPTLGVTTLLLSALYVTMYFVLDKSDNDWPATCNIRTGYRIQCFPGRNETVQVTYEACMAAGCCWREKPKLCYHSIPSRHGYTPRNSGTYKETEGLVPRRSMSPLGSRNAESLNLALSNIDANHLKITLRMGEPRVTRKKRNVHKDSFESEKFSSSSEGYASDELSRKLLHFLPDNSRRRTVNFQDDDKSNMNVYVHSPEFSITVSRKSNTTSHPLLSTARGPLILTETFWELTLYITNSTLYGLNQLQLNGTTNIIYNNENGTTRPAFVGIDDDGLGTSCYLEYDGLMEVKVLDESNLVVVRGFSLPREITLNIFAGPTPLEAVSQMTKALQRNSPTADPPASSLGLHVCPNDNNTEFMESLVSTIEGMQNSEVPWDSHCLHQGYNPTLGNSLDEQQSKLLDEAVKLLADNQDRMLVPHLTPMLFTENNTLATQLANSSLLLSNSSEPYVGLYLNQPVFYPDWFDNRTAEESLPYLTEYMNKFATSKLFYVRDSWPRDETNEHLSSSNFRFDYVPEGLRSLVSNGTVPYTLVTSSRATSHYAEHNGYSEKFRDSSLLQGWTSLTIRGLWGESGNSSWSALRAAVRVGVSSGLVGQLPPPMYICGTGDDLGPGDNNDELCSRWYGAAVAWPHVLALPANLPDGDHLSASASSYAVKHLKFRASLLTYTRTILAEHRTMGLPLLAPTSIHYPEDLRARNRQNQFLWGDSILVGLVTLPRVSQVQMWLPGKYPWRHLSGGSQVYPSNSSATSITTAESQIVTLIRPGYIVPRHEEISMTSVATMKNQLTLVINLACDEECLAKGKIFYGESDGEFLFITANKTSLEFTNVLKVQDKVCHSNTSTQQATVIKYVEVLGTAPCEILIDLCTIQEDSLTTIFKECPKF